MTPLDLLIRVSLVLAAAWTIATLLRRRPAALRHWVLALGIVGAAVAPTITLLAPAWHLPRTVSHSSATAVEPPRLAAQAAPAIAAITAEVIATRQSPVPRRVFNAATLASAAAWVWVGGALVALFALAVGLARLAWIGRRAEPLVDPLWAEVHDEVARAYGLRRRATVLQTDQRLIVTWGAAAPKIVVPRGAVAWPRERIRVVLAHELAHIVRGDWLLQMVAEVTRAVHWCNPLAWIVCRRARLESEHACDDAVLSLGISGSEYASHLLDLARSMHTRRHAWVPAQAIVRPSSLERRVAAMLNVHVNRTPLSRAGRVATAVAAALVTVFAAGFSAAQSSVLSGVISDQLGHQIANVSISLVNLTTNASSDAKSDANGRYEFDGLTAGDYMIKIAAMGFQPVEERVVLTGPSVQQNVQLQMGMVHETITVVDGPSAPMPEAKRALIQTQMLEGRQKLQRDLAQPCPTGGGCIIPPIKLTDQKPVFPDSQVGIGGVVTLTGVIDATGHVSHVQAVGNPNPDLAQAAITAVSQWAFEPTRLDGQVVDTQIQISVAFKSTK